MLRDDHGDTWIRIFYPQQKPFSLPCESSVSAPLTLSTETLETLLNRKLELNPSDMSVVHQILIIINISLIFQMLNGDTS